MTTHFDELVTKLQDAIDASADEKINAQQCIVEAEIVGYLLGKKVAKQDAEYVPESIGSYHTLPLRMLNRVATQAYHAMKHNDDDQDR